MGDNTTVRVAVRVRPLVPTEISRGCREILDVINENEQIVIKSLDKDRAYTFNYAVSSKVPQETFYKRCVESLIDNLFKGYNITILAYGQTGSGKTHTMGTNCSSEEDMGVIPRAVTQIFQFISNNLDYNIDVNVSFLELYQDTLYDLLSSKPKENCVLEIREDNSKGIHIPNLTQVKVDCIEAVLTTLEKGSAGRATSATAMNAQSSRSHAICCITIFMQNKTNCNDIKEAKLHLVDLAGSERAKKTQATGITLKEGININKGLLALGNVISCLGDEKTQNKFVPYRDSSLTRLLKDSLGGNSITLMIACVSPADYNLEETISTLEYADRAKKIKNKPIINQDPQIAEINSLKKTIQLLKLQIIGQGGPVVSSTEVELLKNEISELKSKKKDLHNKLTKAFANNTDLLEKNLIFQNANEDLKLKLVDLNKLFNSALADINKGIETKNLTLIKDTVINFEEVKNQFNQISFAQEKVDEDISVLDRNKHVLENHTEIVDNDDDNDDAQEELHANQQFQLNIQLTEIEKELNVKELLAKQLMNKEFIIDPQALAANEAKILKLEKEKEDLLKQLKSYGNSGKLCEQRRKRVQELEQQIVELKKKVYDQNQLMKQKTKAEERVRILNQEITQMKQTKVKLIKSMREESDKFRQWKLQKEKECVRLKREDAKKEVEITRMKIMHDKQQNVFKKRVAEAEAVNKRLKQALALKLQNQESKNGKVEKMETWLQEEFDLHVSLIEAETTLKALLEDRATLHTQLNELKNNPEHNIDQCKAIEEDLELRSTQIQDIHQKILDSHGGNGIKTRLEKLQTMIEAKHSIKFLFSRVCEEIKERVSCKMKLNEIQELYNETLENLNNIKKLHNVEFDNLKKKYEVKLAIINGTNEVNTTVQDNMDCGDSNEIPMITGTPIKNVKMNNSERDYETPGTPIDVNNFDWRTTPLGKRILQEKRKIELRRKNMMLECDEPTKSSECGCKCKTDCKTQKCECKKLNKICQSLCKCPIKTCKNKEQMDAQQNMIDSEEDRKKPRRDPEPGQSRKSIDLSLSSRKLCTSAKKRQWFRSK